MFYRECNVCLKRWPLGGASTCVCETTMDKRYETEKFWLNEGYYSIKNLEAILKEMRRQHSHFDDALKRAMKETNQ